MSEAYIAGGGMIRISRFPSSSVPGLAVPAVLAAVKDSGMEWEDIEAVYCGHTFGGSMVAQRVCKELGIGGIPMLNVENACSGGAAAMHEAVKAIRSGAVDVALVIGVEKLSALGGGPLPLNEEDHEAQMGLVMPAVYAMRAQRFLHEREASVEDLASVAVQSRRHGVANPYAQQRSEVTIEQVLASRNVAEPLTLLQCCPTGDGAAALIVVSERIQKRLSGAAIKVAASIMHSGTYDPGARPMLRPQITFDSAADAYEEAGFGAEEIDLVELHDAFTISQLIYYEALGLCEVGEAVDFHRSGSATHGGKVVVNPSGGLLSRGHPVGVTGAAQLVEAMWHLRGEAGERQVVGAKRALTHVTGGGIAGFDHGACTVHILERVES